MVILDRDHDTGDVGGFAQCRRVDRLDAVRIDDPHGDTVTLQLFMGRERLVNGGAGGDEREAIFTAVPLDFAAAEGKDVPGVVDDRGVLTHGAQVDHALMEGCRFDELLGG
jgi:hypothetical protein